MFEAAFVPWVSTCHVSSAAAFPSSSLLPGQGTHRYSEAERNAMKGCLPPSATAGTWFDHLSRLPRPLRQCCGW